MLCFHMTFCFLKTIVESSKSGFCYFENIYDLLCRDIISLYIVWCRDHRELVGLVWRVGGFNLPVT